MGIYICIHLSYERTILAGISGQRVCNHNLIHILCAILVNVQ